MTEPALSPEEAIGEGRPASVFLRGFALGLLVAFLALWVVFAFRAIERNDAPSEQTPNPVSFVDRIYTRQIGYATQVSGTNATLVQGRPAASPVASPRAFSVGATPVREPTTTP